MQNFPLDSIGEFNFETQRFRADTGRANGGTIKVVTKSGTNELKGSAFELLPRQEPQLADRRPRSSTAIRKGDYRRNQFGASLGGPIIKDKTHFFAVLRAHPAGHHAVREHAGPLPGQGRRLRDALPREPRSSAKLTHQINPNNYLSVRYGYNNNSQPYGASPQHSARELGRQQEQVPLR